MAASGLAGAPAFLARNRHIPRLHKRNPKRGPSQVIVI